MVLRRCCIILIFTRLIIFQNQNYCLIHVVAIGTQKKKWKYDLTELDFELLETSLAR